MEQAIVIEVLSHTCDDSRNKIHRILMKLKLPYVDLDLGNDGSLVFVCLCDEFDEVRGEINYSVLISFADDMEEMFGKNVEFGCERFTVPDDIMDTLRKIKQETALSLLQASYASQAA